MQLVVKRYKDLKENEQVLQQKLREGNENYGVLKSSNEEMTQVLKGERDNLETKEELLKIYRQILLEYKMRKLTLKVKSSAPEIIQTRKLCYCRMNVK